MVANTKTFASQNSCPTNLEDFLLQDDIGSWAQYSDEEPFSYSGEEVTTKPISDKSNSFRRRTHTTSKLSSSTYNAFDESKFTGIPKNNNNNQNSKNTGNKSKNGKTAHSTLPPISSSAAMPLKSKSKNDDLVNVSNGNNNGTININMNNVDVMRVCSIHINISNGKIDIQFDKDAIEESCNNLVAKSKTENKPSEKNQMKLNEKPSLLKESSTVSDETNDVLPELKRSDSIESKMSKNKNRERQKSESQANKKPVESLSKYKRSNSISVEHKSSKNSHKETNSDIEGVVLVKKVSQKNLEEKTAPSNNNNNNSSSNSNSNSNKSKQQFHGKENKKADALKKVPSEENVESSKALKKMTSEEDVQSSKNAKIETGNQMDKKAKTNSGNSKNNNSSNNNNNNNNNKTNKDFKKETKAETKKIVPEAKSEVKTISPASLDNDGKISNITSNINSSKKKGNNDDTNKEDLSHLIITPISSSGSDGEMAYSINSELEKKGKKSTDKNKNKKKNITEKDADKNSVLSKDNDFPALAISVSEPCDLKMTANAYANLANSNRSDNKGKKVTAPKKTTTTKLQKLNGLSQTKETQQNSASCPDLTKAPDCTVSSSRKNSATITTTPKTAIKHSKPHSGVFSPPLSPATTRPSSFSATPDKNFTHLTNESDAADVLDGFTGRARVLFVSENKKCKMAQTFFEIDATTTQLSHTKFYVINEKDFTPQFLSYWTKDSTRFPSEWKILGERKRRLMVDLGDNNENMMAA